MEILVAIVSPFIALISGLILWFFNERGKRAYQTYLEKLKLYEGLIIAIESFYQGSNAIEKRQDFNNKLALAWMYCSKNVLEKADAFLETTRVGNTVSDEGRAEALDQFMKAIRKDMQLGLPTVKFKPWIST